MTDGGKRSIGFWRAWGLVVGLMIGSGVFMLPTVLAPYGGLGLMSWLITGTGTMAVAWVLAALAMKIPRVGGPYAYTREGLGNFAGFLMAWGFWISVWIASAAIATACVGYLGVFYPPISHDPTLSIITALVIIWGLTFINCRSLKESSIFQLVTTVLKVGALIALALIGLLAVEPANYPAFNPTGKEPVGALIAASALTLWAFVGFEVGTIPAGDIKSPERTIPRALLAGVGLVVVLYFGVTVAVFGLVPYDTLVTSTSPLSDAATALVGPIGAYVVAAVAVIATASALNANIVIVGQIPMAAAMDGIFPPKFAALGRTGTPAFSFLIGAVLSSGAVILNYVDGLVSAFEFLILLSTLTTLIPYIFSAAALWVIGRRTGQALDWRTNAIAFVAFLYSLWAMAGTGPESVYWGFLLLMLGLPVYSLMKSKGVMDQ